MQFFVRAALPLLLVFSGAAGMYAVEPADFRWSGRVAPGKTVEVKGVNGAVRAQASASERVELVAYRSGRRSDPQSVRIEVLDHPDGVTICAVYPSADGATNECRPGSGGRMVAHKNDVKVDFELKVPRGVRFVARTVNGQVAVDLPESEVEAHTVNGGVRVTAAGVASAETVNGAVEVEVSHVRQPMRIKTVNGAVEVLLPAGTRAEFEGKTVGGAITTDVPFTEHRAGSRRHRSGSIGEPGGPKLDVQTVNGAIRVRTKG